MGAGVMDLLANWPLQQRESMTRTGLQQAQTQEARARVPLTEAQTTGAGLENQQREQQLKDSQVLSDAYKNTDGSPDQIRKYLGQNGISGQGRMSWEAHHLDNLQKVANLDKAGREKESWVNEQTGAALSAVIEATPENKQSTWETITKPRYEHLHPGTKLPDAYLGDDWAKPQAGGVNYTGKLLEHQKSAGDIRKEEIETQAKVRQQAIQELSGLIDPATGAPEPGAYAEWQQRNPHILPAKASPAMIASAVRGAVPVEKQPEYDINTTKAHMGLMGNSEYDQFLAQYSKSLGKTPAQLTPQEGMASFQKFAEYKRDPVMRDAAIAQMNLANTLKKIQLDQAPTKEDAKRLADDIQNHRLAPSQLSEIRGRAGGSLGLMIEREMPKGFNWQEADSEYQLGKSPAFQQTVKYMDYVGSSVDNVIKAADKLANGKVRSINAVKNWTAHQLNGVDIARFNTDRLEVADAIAKILQGGGSGSGTSDMKLKQAQDLISSTDSPEVVRATLDEVKGLISNRRKTLTKGTFMEQKEETAPAKTTQTGSPRPPLSSFEK